MMESGWSLLDPSEYIVIGYAYNYKIKIISKIGSSSVIRTDQTLNRSRYEFMGLRVQPMVR
ncbi:hypothetical protein CDL15_Pgr012444 [Punica granatum]|uniref:Uncharacterized protein n=1 Tax=Punica granatum TaxID=22663 RepID=A0A218X088_PUNGR|nr:hypothetical protein CDL15_Pgr012444 [Punica granatum]